MTRLYKRRHSVSTLQVPDIPRDDDGNVPALHYSPVLRERTWRLFNPDEPAGWVCDEGDFGKDPHPPARLSNERSVVRGLPRHQLEDIVADVYILLRNGTLLDTLGPRGPKPPVWESLRVLPEAGMFTHPDNR